MNAVDDDVAAAVRHLHKSLDQRYNVLIQLLCSLLIFHFRRPLRRFCSIVIRVLLLGLSSVP